MLKLPPLPALRAFEAVSRLGSVTRAADELHVTHSAISHQVKLLEDYLGIALIDRSARRMHLTNDGRTYAYQIRQSMQQISSMSERISQRHQSEQITVSVIPSFATHWLIPRLPLFYKEYPEWRIELIASLELTDFEASDVDCAIRFGDVSTHGLRSERLMSEWQLLVSAHDNLNYHGEQKAAVTFAKGTALLAHEDLANWAITAGIDTPAIKEPLIVNDSNLALEAVRSGVIDFTLIRWSIAANWVQQGFLKRITPHMPKHRTSYHIVWPNRSHDSVKLDVFKTWLKQQCKAFEELTLSGHYFAQQDESLAFGFLKNASITLPLKKG